MKNRVRPLTERQRQALEFIRAYIAERGYPPSVNEIARHFGVLHNAAQCYLLQLEKKRAIQRTHGVARSIRILEAADAQEAAD